MAPSLRSAENKRIVAVAGGTSPGLGRSILTGLLQKGTATPIVLARKESKTPSWLEGLGIEVKRVDYENEDDITNALNGVHTLICTILPKDGSSVPKQITLLNAALKAGVTRFVPAEWGPGPKATPNVTIIAAQTKVWDACREAVTRANSDADGETAGGSKKFEWASFHIGLFMNYVGVGAPDQEAALGGINEDGKFIFDLGDNKVTVPVTADGEFPRITLTDVRDVGRFVAAAVDSPLGSWEEHMHIAGDTQNLGDMIKIIERVRGEKVNVIARSSETVAEEKKSKMTNPADILDLMWLELEESIARNEKGDGYLEGNVNKMFPDIKTTSFEEYVTKYWAPTS